MHETTSEDGIPALAERYACENGWMLNPGRKKLTTAVHGLGRNEEPFGALSCPCRTWSGDLERDPAINLACIRHRDDIEKDGPCHSPLHYQKKNAAVPETPGIERDDRGG